MGRRRARETVRGIGDARRRGVGEDAGEFLEVHPVTSKEWPEEIYPTVRVDPSKNVPFSKPSFIQVISVRISKDIIDNDFGTLPEESWRKLQEVRE